MAHNNGLRNYLTIGHSPDEDSIRGNRSEHQEEAITYVLIALEFFTRESYPGDYAQTQGTLGTVYKQCTLRRPNLLGGFPDHGLVIKLSQHCGCCFSVYK